MALYTVSQEAQRLSGQRQGTLRLTLFNFKIDPSAYVNLGILGCPGRVVLPDLGRLCSEVCVPVNGRVLYIRH